MAIETIAKETEASETAASGASAASESENESEASESAATVATEGSGGIEGIEGSALRRALTIAGKCLPRQAGLARGRARTRDHPLLLMAAAR